MKLDTRQHRNCTLIGRNPHDTQRTSVQSNSGEIIEDESLWIEYASTSSPLLPQGLGNGDRDESQRTNYVPKSNPHALYKCVHIRPTQLLIRFSTSIPSKFANEYWYQTRVQPTETNTAQHNLQILLVVGYPTTNKCLVGIGYPTTNIHHFKSWCCVPNTNNCWVVLGTQLFSEKDPAWEKNHFCLKGFFLVQKTSLLWLILNLSSSSTNNYNIWSKVG